MCADGFIDFVRAGGLIESQENAETGGFSRSRLSAFLGQQKNARGKFV